MNCINEIIENILKEKEKQDTSEFLRLLKEELNKNGVALKIRKTELSYVPPEYPTIVGVELDLSEYDKKKDAEIEKLKEELRISNDKNEFLDSENEKLAKVIDRKGDEIAKYKNEFESAKRESDKMICKYQEQIKQLENRNQELQEALIEIPNEPIKVADFLIDKFEDLERQDIINSKPEYIENVSVCKGEKATKICKLGEYHLRQIAKHLLIYCEDSEG